jgi:hypothetical protein
MVEEGIREKRALERVAQTNIDVVITGFQTEHCLARPVEQAPIKCAREGATRVDAIIVLMELIAQGRIGREPGEVVEEIERIFDDVGIRFPQTVVVGVRKPG